MKHIFRILVAISIGLPATVHPAGKPNIVVILADDLGYGSLGCYGADTNLVRTPNCDRLARGGIRFTDANTPASVCSPTRYGLLTGRYCWRTSLKYGVLKLSPLHIETNRLTIASLLKRQGYATAAIGKWHLGYGDNDRVDFREGLQPGPLEIGFDYHFGLPSNHGSGDGVFIEDHGIAGLRSRKLTPYGTNHYGGKPFKGYDAPQREDENVMAVLTDKAISWIEQQRQPFFLYFAPVAVHEPVTPSDRTKGTSKAGPYGDWIHELDLRVGQLLDALDRRGLATNTLVIFTSDNGGEIQRVKNGMQIRAQEAGLKINGSLRGGKHSIYEGGFRVPFIARWPGKIPVGAVSGETINLVDLLATTAALVGETLPPAIEAAEDSFNVLPALLGKKSSQPLRPNMVLHSADGVFAVLQGPWKWIEGKPANPTPRRIRLKECHPQLYNLTDDPKEKQDVIEEHPKVAQQLEKQLAAWREQGYSRE